MSYNYQTFNSICSQNFAFAIYQKNITKTTPKYYVETFLNVQFEKSHFEMKKINKKLVFPT